MKRLPGLVLAVAALLPAALPGEQAPPPASDRTTAVDALFAAWDRTDSPGCALGVFQDGRMAYARGYGMANLELHVANSPETVFDIGSLGKQFTAFSILLLARDGKLSLDDDIRKFLPEIPDYGHRVTIRHLLHHTGGLRDYLALFELEGLRTEDVTTEQDALDVLARQKGPLFAPGARYEYSNSGYFLLGVIVKRSSGRSLRDFARERIFEPLSMTHSQYSDDHTRIIPNRATAYEAKEGGGLRIDMSDFEQNGDGGMFTTVEDLLLWDRNFTDPIVGDGRLLGEMQTPGALAGGKPLDYAAGLRVGTYRGLRTIGHTGSWAGYRALLYRFPDQKFSVAILCNRPVDRLPLMRRVAELHLGDLMEKEAAGSKAPAKPAISLPASELARLSGAYRDPKTGEVWFLEVEGGTLVADAQGSKLRLDSVAPDRFVSREGGGLELRLAAARPGGRPRLEATWGEEASQSFEPIAVWSPTASQVAEFAGAYTSDEVPALFRFAAVGGKLVLRHRTIASDPWKPTLPDSFARRDLSASFTRDARGKVDGFRLSAGGMSGILFRKIGR
ncbi:MAG: serine hydrolase domain-containing protein [Thermoanaerobaculia bacterium]